MKCFACDTRVTLVDEIMGKCQYLYEFDKTILKPCVASKIRS